MEVKDLLFNFEDFYSRLLAYKERKGHLNIKNAEKDIDGYPIGQKITDVKRGSIKLDKKQKHELIDLGLNLGNTKNFDFEGFYARLVAYKARNGHLNIKTSEKDIDGYPIGLKIKSVKQRHVKVTLDQIELLRTLGLDLQIKKSVFIFEFKDFYTRLVAYKSRNGHLNIKQAEKDIDGYPLGEKIKNIKRGLIKLIEEQRRQLLDLGLNLEVKSKKKESEDGLSI